MQMQQATKASAPSAAAVTVMAVTAVSAMANVLNVRSAATMQMHPHRRQPRKRLRKQPTVVRAILQSPTAAPPKGLVLQALLLRQPRRWPTLPSH